MNFPLFFFGHIYYYHILLKEKKVTFEINENFPKQTYRNRFEIIGANGVQILSIPLENRSSKSPYKSLKISFEENWQNHHWKTLTSAFNSSPYFELLEQDFKPLYFKKEKYLFDYNLLLFEWINDFLQLNIQYSFTKSFKGYSNALVNSKSFQKKGADFSIKKYNQVFSDKINFQYNLSILDLVFNLGKEARLYLQTDE